MSMKILHESDMDLCYNEEDTFLCENYIKNYKLEDIKTVEYITLYKNI